MSRISTIRHYHGQPVLLTMVYSVISIGLYYPFWLLWQTRVANRLVPQKKISTPFIAACFILSFVNVLFLVLARTP